MIITSNFLSLIFCRKFISLSTWSWNTLIYRARTRIYIYIYSTRIIASLNSSFHCFEFHNTRFVIYFSLYTVSKIIILFRIFFWRLIFVTTTVKTLSSTSTNFARVIRYVQRPVFVGRNYGGGERQGKFFTRNSGLGV